MSSLREFVDSWNDLMPFVPINEQELKNPNEVPLRRWLIAILKQLKVKMDWIETIDGESGNSARLLKIRLTAYVNHFYKVSNPTAKDKEFYYMDLVQPSEFYYILLKKKSILTVILDYKKTFNVLRSILNYCAFVNHMINMTIVPANEELKKRDELLTIKNKLKAEIEEVKIREEKNAEQIRELDALIPQQKQKLRELNEEEHRDKAEAIKYQIESEEIELQIGELRNKLKELSSSVILDEECDSILNAKKQLGSQVHEISQIADSARHNLVEVSRKIIDASQVVNRMETIAVDIASIDIKSRHKEWKELENVKSEIKQLNDQLVKVTAEITSLKQHIKCQNKSLEQSKKTLDEYRAQFGGTKAEMKPKIKQAKETLKTEQAKQNKLASENIRLREESKKLYEITVNVLKHIASQSYDKRKTG